MNREDNKTIYEYRDRKYLSQAELLFDIRMDFLTKKNNKITLNELNNIRVKTSLLEVSNHYKTGDKLLHLSQENSCFKAQVFKFKNLMIEISRSLKVNPIFKVEDEFGRISFMSPHLFVPYSEELSENLEKDTLALQNIKEMKAELDKMEYDILIKYKKR